MTRNAERGEGRAGFLGALVVVGIIAFVSFKVIPAKIDAYEFRETLREEARFAAVRHDDKDVVSRLLKKAHEMEIPLDRKNIAIRRTTGEMIISATYEQPIDLKVTTYVYKFDAKERAPLF